MKIPDHYFGHFFNEGQTATPSELHYSKIHRKTKNPFIFQGVGALCKKWRTLVASSPINQITPFLQEDVDRRFTLLKGAKMT